MKPFNKDTFKSTMEQLGCKVEYGNDNLRLGEQGFYFNGEYIFSFEDIFPEAFEVSSIKQQY